MFSNSKNKPLDRRTNFMYGKALSYVDSVTRHGLFRERTNIKLDRTDGAADLTARGNTREAFLALRFPLLGPNRNDADTYHRQKRKNRKPKRTRSPVEDMFDIRKSHAHKSPPLDHTGFLPAIETNQGRRIAQSWDTKSVTNVRPNLNKTSIQYQSLPDIRNLRQPSKSKHREVPSNGRVIFPSLHGYHPRSNSPTYKQLVRVKERLCATVDNWVKEFYHVLSVDSNVTPDEFYRKFICNNDGTDEDEGEEELSKPETKDGASQDFIPLVAVRPKLEFWVEMDEFERRLRASDVSEGTEQETFTNQPSVYSLWLASEVVDDRHRSLRSPEGNLMTERTTESLHLVKKASKSNVAGWGKEADDHQELEDLKTKMERSLKNDKISRAPGIEHGDRARELTVHELSRQSTKVKLALTEDISANLDAVMARIDSLDKQIDVDSVGTALENIGGKPKTTRFTNRASNKIAAEEEKKRKRLQAVREKIQKSRPMNVGALMYEKHKAQAVHRLARLGNLTSEEANDLFLTRDHKVLSQKFIERYNEVAYGSDSSDDEVDE